MFFLHILILYHLLEEVIFTLYYLYTTTKSANAPLRLSGLCRKGNFYCSNKACSFCLWEDNKFFSGKKKKLTKRIAKELLDKGWCRVTGLYTPKKPQLYDAVIRLDDSGGKYVSFKMEFDR